MNQSLIDAIAEFRAAIEAKACIDQECIDHDQRTEMLRGEQSAAADRVRNARVLLLDLAAGGTGKRGVG